jgi:hypothetical protein
MLTQDRFYPSEGLTVTLPTRHATLIADALTTATIEPGPVEGYSTVTITDPADVRRYLDLASPPKERWTEDLGDVNVLELRSQTEATLRDTTHFKF